MREGRVEKRIGRRAEQLNRKTRGQLRRAQRLAGDVTVDIARTAPDAIAIYDELVALHGAHWRRRGLPGAFADRWFERVHRRLIAKRFDAGEIQLVRVRNASHTIGCLYNFVFRDRVSRVIFQWESIPT